MKNVLFALALFVSATGFSQTYTNQYPKELTRLAQKWVKKDAWRNGFTKASPAPTVNPVEFYIQYDRLEQFTSIPGTFNIMFPCDWHVAKVKTNEASQKLRVLVIKVDYKL